MTYYNKILYSLQYCIVKYYFIISQIPIMFYKNTTPVKRFGDNDHGIGLRYYITQEYVKYLVGAYSVILVGPLTCCWAKRRA